MQSNVAWQVKRPLFFYCYGDHRDLHSFPTRRSSDLIPRATVFRHLCHQRGLDPAAVDACLYTHVDRDAVSHTFRVAASLDSMMIGEPQILGQVKDAFALAQACEAVGPALHSLFTHAFAVAKKVRTETDVGRYAVSVSFAAVELAKKIFDGLS